MAVAGNTSEDGLVAQLRLSYDVGMGWLSEGLAFDNCVVVGNERVRELGNYEWRLSYQELRESIVLLIDSAIDDLSQ